MCVALSLDFKHDESVMQGWAACMWKWGSGSAASETPSVMGAWKPGEEVVRVLRPWLCSCREGSDSEALSLRMWQTRGVGSSRPLLRSDESWRCREQEPKSEAPVVPRYTEVHGQTRAPSPDQNH
ncbi:hypothetical protein MJT46_003468 [Ovis ammon polii x Ovis aries]|nr:hypothetical protein MJT46_003468 [Ovis ammon polii x Ovis aries]